MVSTRDRRRSCGSVSRRTPRLPSASRRNLQHHRAGLTAAKTVSVYPYTSHGGTSPRYGHHHQRDRRRADLSTDRQPGQVLSGVRAAPARRRASGHPDAGAAAEGDAKHHREGVRRTGNFGRRAQAPRLGHVRLGRASAAGAPGAAPHHRAAHRRPAGRGAPVELHRRRHPPDGPGTQGGHGPRDNAEPAEVER